MASCDCFVNGYEFINDNDSINTDVNGKTDISVKIREECSHSCITLSLFHTLNTTDTPLEIVTSNVLFIEYHGKILKVFGKIKIFIKLKSVTFKWDVLIVNRKVRRNMDLASTVVLGQDFIDACEAGVESVRFGEVYLRGFYYRISYLYIKTCTCLKVFCSCRTLELMCADRADRAVTTQSSHSADDWT